MIRYGIIKNAISKDFKRFQKISVMSYYKKTHAKAKLQEVIVLLLTYLFKSNCAATYLLICFT